MVSFEIFALNVFSKNIQNQRNSGIKTCPDPNTDSDITHIISKVKNKIKIIIFYRLYFYLKLSFALNKLW
ncbi:Uncharacterised protein, partial [Mycoplasmopsis synoviae]